MRWLLIGLLISVAVLLFLAGAVTRHILRQRRENSVETPPEDASLKNTNIPNPQAPE